jgi:hypothetical protein
MDGTRALNFELAGCNASGASRSWLIKRRGLKRVMQSSLSFAQTRIPPTAQSSIVPMWVYNVWDGNSDPITHRCDGFNVQAASHSRCKERRLTAANKNDKRAWDFVLDALMAPASLGTCERRESAMSRSCLQNVCLVLGHEQD